MPTQKNGIIGTIVYHIIILLILLFFGFSAPLPPQGDEGILINFGDSPRGLGNREPMQAELKPQEKVEQSQPAQKTDISGTKQELLTQDFEEAPVVASKEVKKKKEPEKEIVRETKPVTEEKKEEVKQPVVNTRALYSGKSPGTETGSQGITETGGNQGNPDGSPESDNYIGSGLGTTGIGFDLEGRSGVHLPPPPANFQRGGVVIVEILVDQEGRVVSAREGVRGSTTQDITLLKLAREAALKSKFSAKSDAAVHQKGYITYTFRVRN
jgi:colicin import membrane protein